MPKKRPRVSDWLAQPAPVQSSSKADDANVEYLLAALRSRAPGMWSQNLLELSRHFTSAAFLAINTQGNQAAAAEVKAFERTPDPDDGDLELAWDDPLCRLLRRPNDEDSTGDLLYTTSQQLGLTGVALIWMPPGDAGRPRELYVLPSASALPQPPSPLYPHGSYLIQPYFPYGPFATIPSYQSAAGARIPADQVIKVKNHHPFLRYDGYAVLTAMSLQMDTIDAIDRARWKTQMKGVEPTLSIEFDPEVVDLNKDDMRRLREQIKALYAGPNGESILMNPTGTKLSPISGSPKDMAWQDGWGQLVDFALACYGVPKSVAGLQDDVSYATLFASMRQYYLLSLGPLLRKISDKLNRSLVEPYFGDDLYVTLEGQKITDEDLQEKQLATDISAGNVLRVDEYRKIRKQKPLGGEEGKAFVGGKGQDVAAQPRGPQVTDPDQLATDRHRPESGQGEGAGGPTPDRFAKAERLAAVLERYKTDGTIFSTNGKH